MAGCSEHAEHCIRNVCEVVSADGYFEGGEIKYLVYVYIVLCMFYERLCVQTIGVVTTLKFTSKGETKSCWKPIQTGLQLACQSFLSLHDEMVLRRKLLKFLLCGRVSQDALENVFSQIRNKGVSHPRPSKFRIGLRVVSLSQLLQVSSKSSYEEDDTPYPLDFVKKDDPAITTQSAAITTQSAAEAFDLSIYIDALQFLESDCEMNGFYYICGWSVEKILRKVCCDNCCAYLSNSSVSSFDNSAMLTLIRSYIKNPLNYNFDDVTTYLYHPSQCVLDFMKKVEIVFKLHIVEALTAEKPISFIRQSISFQFPTALSCRVVIFERIFNSYVKLRYFVHSKELSKQCNEKQFASKTAARQRIT